MKTPREKYNNDPNYRLLVDWMISHIDQCNYTPSELREASILASIIQVERNPIRFMPKSMENKLKILEDWTNNPDNSSFTFNYSDIYDSEK